MASNRPVVLVTGSEGRIGSAIAASLSDAHTVVGLERQCREPNCIEADITSAENVSQALETLRSRHGGRIAAVVHLAAFYDFSDEPNPLYDAVNVEGTRTLLRALQAFEVDQFIYASTMLVHAPGAPGRPINEASPLAPAWPYPQSKLAAERVVEFERGEMKALTFRMAGVYTDDCELPSLANQIQRIFERQTLSRVFPGDATHGQSFVHIDDVVDAVRAAIDRCDRLPQQATLLVGEPHAESYESLQNLIAWLLHGEPWETLQLPKSLATVGAWVQEKAEGVVPDAIDQGKAPFIKPFMVGMADDHYELDISRAESLLGWRPRHTVRRSLQTMLARLKSNPEQWYRRNKLTVPLWLAGVDEAGRSGAQLIANYNMLARSEHQQTLWCHFANIGLGMWLIASPFVFGLAQQSMQAGEFIAPNGRGLAHSAAWMSASDIITGALVMLFAFLSLSRDLGWARWITAGLGLWLLFAPVLFWTPSAAAFANDTLVGALLILFAVAIPAAPGISPVARTSGPDAPPGWDYSPSGWTNRVPIVVLALVGLFISRYLAAYQLGHISAAWDPFFGDGTERIITSSVSEAWPVSDAALGATVYVLEIVTGVIGDKRRWRTMPWLVLLFGILIVPLGVVSVFFIIIQPIVIGTWCTLCLVGALAMLLQIPYSFDEILATIQFLKARQRQGRPWWYVLLRGDTMDGGKADYTDNFEAPVGAIVREMLLSGVSVPWNLLLSLLIGIALMCTRLLFDTAGQAADNDHLIGALVVTFTIMAWADVARPLRLVNAAFGAWLLMAPWILDGYVGAATLASMLLGAALVVLAYPAGKFKNHFGAWDKVARLDLQLPGRRTNHASA